MLLRAGKNGHNIITVAAAIIFRALHHPDVGVARAHAAQLHGAEGPQVVHLINQHSVIDVSYTHLDVYKRQGMGSAYGGKWRPSKPEDKRFLGEPEILIKAEQMEKEADMIGKQRRCV